MNKEEVLNIIKKHITDNIDDLDGAAIDVTRSMRDYGANSLDIIEVVSSSMRELKIKIPRTELSNIPTIDKLADKFLEYIE